MMICRLKKLLVRDPETTKTTHAIPWNQELRDVDSRYLYGQYPEFEAIKHLRDNEIVNPAPFSHRSLIEIHNYSTSQYECPIDVRLFKTNSHNTYKMNVPVMNIIGAEITTNMHNFSCGKTYREVLFTCLHGAGLEMDALDFLVSDRCKSQEMPHTRIGHDKKTRSQGELKLTRYGNYFFSSHGHQRTVLAMYAIWQREGVNGLLKNVTVNEPFPLPMQNQEVTPNL